MTIFLVLIAASVGAVVGMWYEYHTGRFDHFTRRITKPRFQTPQPVLHDDFIDGCEQFNQAVLQTAIEKRLFAESETIQ